MSRVDSRPPHLSPEESRICAANLAGMEPADLLAHILIAFTGDRPVVVTGLRRPQLIAALAGVLAVLTEAELGDPS